MYLDSSSAMRLVSVVTSTRSPILMRSSISSSKSSTWLVLGRTSISGSNKPVGRMICSTTTPPASLQFVIAGRSTHKNGLAHHAFKLIKGKRAVIHGRRQPETIFHQLRFARAVAAPHGPHLRHGSVAFVDHHQIIVGEII